MRTVTATLTSSLARPCIGVTAIPADHLGWLTAAPIFWFTWLADSVLLAGLGLLLGVGVLKIQRGVTKPE